MPRAKSEKKEPKGESKVKIASKRIAKVLKVPKITLNDSKENKVRKSKATTTKTKKKNDIARNSRQNSKKSV